MAEIETFLAGVQEHMPSLQITHEPDALRDYTIDGILPRLVVTPDNKEQAAQITALVSQHSLTLLARGGGSRMNLGGIPEELYEAARLDGAGYWAIMWQIAFPLMLDMFGVVVILQFLYILSGAAQNVILLTNGGPGTAATTLGYYLYNEAFIAQRLGYSQAIAVVVFFIGIVVILLIRRVTSRLSDF